MPGTGTNHKAASEAGNVRPRIMETSAAPNVGFSTGSPGKAGRDPLLVRTFRSKVERHTHKLTSGHQSEVRHRTPSRSKRRWPCPCRKRR